MSVEITIDRIVNLIQSGMVAVESQKILAENLSFIGSAKIEGKTSYEIEVDSVINIYSRRDEQAKSQGRVTIGFEELMEAIKNFSGSVRPVLAVSEKYNIIFFLAGEENFIIGSIFVEK